MILTVGAYGYTTFLPGCKSERCEEPCLAVLHKLTCALGWDVGTFFSYYTMCFVCPILYVGWKVVKKTKVVKPAEADLVRTSLSIFLPRCEPYFGLSTREPLECH